MCDGAGAPLEISEDLITTFNISQVVRGTISETSTDGQVEGSTEQRYTAPKASGIFRQAHHTTVKLQSDHLACLRPPFLLATQPNQTSCLHGLLG